MAKLRKKVRMIVTVSVPVTMSAADACREVRTLINEQANCEADPEDVKARAVRPMYFTPSRAPQRLCL